MMLKLGLGQRGFRTGLFAVLALTANAVGHAALMRYEYGGTITSADPSTGITPGSRFSGTFTYDPAGSPSAMMIEGQTTSYYGLLSFPPGAKADGSGITLQIGDKSVVPDPGGVSVTVSEQQYAGQWGYRNADGTGTGPSTAVTIGNIGTKDGPFLGLELANPTRSLVQSLAPPTSFNLADFPLAQMSVSGRNLGGPASVYTGTIDTLQEVPVPEPPWTTLLCLAAAGWLTRSARRIRNPLW